MYTLKNIIKESLLLESRVDDVFKKYPQIKDIRYDSNTSHPNGGHFLGQPIINHLIQQDPSGNNKYLMWMVKQIVELMYGWDKRNVTLASYRMLQDVKYFHENLNRFKEKDINKYTFRRLHQNVEEIQSSPTKSKLKKESDRIYEDEHVLLISPKSHAASCYYGANTRWCTASKGRPEIFDNYVQPIGNSGTGLVYIIFKKEDEKIAARWFRGRHDFNPNITWYSNEDHELGDSDVKVQIAHLMDFYGRDKHYYKELSRESKNYVNKIMKIVYNYAKSKDERSLGKKLGDVFRVTK